MTVELRRALNRLAGTNDLGEQAAANVAAGTKNLDLLAALNRKAGTQGLGMRAVCNRIAGTKDLDPVGALNAALIYQATDPVTSNVEATV